MPRKEGMGENTKKQTLNVPLSLVKLSVTLWMVYQYTQSLQNAGVLPNSFPGKQGNRSGIST
jgi:hypothetical protein